VIGEDFDVAELPIHRPRPDAETFDGFRRSIKLPSQPIDNVIVFAKFVADGTQDSPNLADRFSIASDRKPI
jgi:hypothetical protein